MKMAEAGLEELQQYVDTLLIIPNQNLFRVANEKTTFADAFKMADDVLYSGVRGVTDLMVMPGLINLDFADIKSVMGEMGKAMMGTGEAEGERRATEAAEQAIANPLLDDISMSGAKGVLINITAGSDITLFEVDEAANRIRDEVDGDSNIIFGSTFDETLEGRVRVSVVATGIESVAGVRREPAEAEKIAPPAAVAPVNMIPRPEEVAIEPEIEPEPIAEEPVIGEAPLPEDDKIPTFLSNIKKDDDVFIPTEPAVTTGASETEMPADPFAAADMVNAHKEPEVKKTPKKSGLSLFERVTGVARGDKKRAEVIKPEPEEAIEIVAEVPPEPEPILEPETGIVAEAVVEEPVAEKIEIEPVMEAVPDPIPEPLVETAEESAAETVVESPAEMPAGAAEKDIPPPQNLLGDLDSEDRLTGAQDEEDVLDIPAFLRRQAN